MNVVMTGRGRFIEVQGTAEQEPFDDAALKRLMAMAKQGIRRITAHQRKLLAGSGLLPE